MNILWHSNAPWVPTGYGQQTAAFTRRIRDLGHNVAISAFWGLGGAAMDWEGMRVYPADESWGDRMLGSLARHHGAGEDCLVITLMDVWVMNADLHRKLNVASWVPVDHDPIPPRVLEWFKRAGARPIAMSRFGEQKLLERGLDALYVPHGIDTTVFAPGAGERDQVRAYMRVPEDAFVVGMVAANKGTSPPRKAFPQVFQAFARMRREHPDAFLYLHTELAGNTQGLNLGALAAACGIPSEAIRYTPQAKLELGIHPGDLAQLYGALDVLANPSYGEGFGVPIVEAQACGTPVIVTDWTAMTELCGAGWLVDGEPWYNATQGSFYKCPSVDSLHRALEQAYEHRGDQDLRAQARAYALAYDADQVLQEHWIPVLEQLEVPAPAELVP